MQQYLELRQQILASAIEQTEASLNALLGAQQENKMALAELDKLDLDADVQAQKEVEGQDGSE